MENLTLDELKGLAQQVASPSVSIFLPTERSGPDTQQAALRLKNLLRDAREELVDRGMRRPAVSELLKPAQALLDDTIFWEHQYDGLAIFLGPDDFHTYHLPFAVEELLVIARSYYVTPVLPLFTNNGHYYILAISQKAVRLFEGTRDSVGQVDLPAGTPRSLAEALGLDDPERQLQMRTAGPHGGEMSGIFHGHGPGEEEQKERIERYLNLVDAGLKGIFCEQPAPVVVAGVDYLLPIYRKVSDCAHVMPEGITGSPEHWRPEELQEKAWPIVEPHFRQETEEVVAQYRALAATDRATDRIEEVVRAAFFGRVDRLLLYTGTEVWGRFDNESGEVVPYGERRNEEDELPLVDFAAMQTLQNGGSVYALAQEEMPTGSPVAAVLRY